MLHIPNIIRNFAIYIPHTCNTSLQPQTQGRRIKLKEAVRVVKTGDVIPHLIGTVGAISAEEYDELKAIIDKQSKQIAQQQKEISAMKAADPIYETVADLPEWGKPSIEKAISKGIIEGTGKNKKGDIIINMLESLVRAYVSMDRAGLY